MKFLVKSVNLVLELERMTRMNPEFDPSFWSYYDAERIGEIAEFIKRELDYAKTMKEQVKELAG